MCIESVYQALRAILEVLQLQIGLTGLHGSWYGSEGVNNLKNNQETQKVLEELCKE